MNHVLHCNATHILNHPALCNAVTLRDQYSHHLTDSTSKIQSFSCKVACAIYDSKEGTFLTPDIRAKADFLVTIFSNPDKYWWELPIAHLIPQEHDYKVHQDACPQGAREFSDVLDYWWTVIWPHMIFLRTQLPTSDKHYISNNLLEFATLSFGLVDAILAWEALPVDSRPVHPMVLLWTDNMTAREWVKKISGIKTPQGCSLVRILAHLLMFPDLGIKAQHVKGLANVIADFLSHIAITHNPSTFSYHHVQTQFPWLWLSYCHVLSNKKLLALVCSALSNQSVNIPTTRVTLRQLRAEPPTLTQTFFGMSK